MKTGMFVIGLIVLFAAAFGSAQVEGGFVEPKLKNTPSVVVPKEAGKTNLGGRVVVHVIVDEDGRVSSINEVVGPGAVCASVEREDVVAIRNEAVRAAKLALFIPAMANNAPAFSKTTIEFDFPVRPIEDGGKEEHYQVKAVGTGKAQETTLSGESPLDRNAILLPKPLYPRSAIAVNAAGEVRVQVLILEDGTMFSAEAVSGHPLLRASSVLAACGAKFTPTLLSGKPVKVAGFISYNFSR